MFQEHIVRTYKFAVIPGDGIGTEVIAESVATLRFLETVDPGIRFEIEMFDWGTERYLQVGSLMPPDGVKILQESGFDAILLGPVGDPRVPDHTTLWGLLLPIRQGCEQYINLRPMHLLEGVQGVLRDKTSADIDMVCVRENTEGEYAGVGGRLHQNEHEVALQAIVFTRRATERVMRYAFEYARQHDRKLVTSATKSNSMQFNMVFWDEVFASVASEYPDIRSEKQLIDSLAARMVQYPESLDVIVASNLFGDILTDLGAGVAGGLGLAASANLNPEKRFPSLFQAIHGSAPDICGKGIANPIGSLLSLQMMFSFLGETTIATALEEALKAHVASGNVLTPDMGGKATTVEMGSALRKRLQRMLVLTPA